MTIPSLDGLRALAVLIVMLAHAGLGHVVPGGLGVTVFFFLSGYLITTLLLRERDASGTIAVAPFYARRLLRLMPPLLVTLLLAYGLNLLGWLPGQPTWMRFCSQLFYFANYYALFWATAPGPGGTEVLWSLAVEEHFYLLYPALLLVLLRGGRTRRHAAVVLALLCVATLAWRGVLTGMPGFHEARTYYASDTRMDSIMYGCILALACNPMGPQGPRAIAPRRAWAWGLTGLALLLATLLVREPRFRETLRYSLQGLALMPLFYVAITHRGSLVWRLLNHPLAVRVGVYSYAMYLIHAVVAQGLAAHGALWRLHPLALFAAMLAVSLAYARWIDRWLDPPFRRRRQRLR